jgi:hypothetical protein
MHNSHYFDIPILSFFLTLLLNLFDFIIKAMGNSNVTTADISRQIILAFIGATVAFFVTLIWKKIRKSYQEADLSRKITAQYKQHIFVQTLKKRYAKWKNLRQKQQ